MYSYKIEDSVEVKKAKGVKNSLVKKEINFEDYQAVLNGGERSKKKVKFNKIRSYNHQLKSIEQTKIELNSLMISGI